jgi:hypothetical protein
MKREIERALGTFAFVNLYASWGNASGTNDHWDDQRHPRAPADRPQELEGAPGHPPVAVA